MLPFDFREAVGMDFTMHSQFLYGLPERAERMLLKPTEYSFPYRLYNLDVFEHKPNNP
jgi:Galactose mutarotase-like